MLCSLVLDATVKSLNDVPWTVGDEFDVVSVSIDPQGHPRDRDARSARRSSTSYPRAHGATQGLALPRRRRGEHPQGDRRHRLPVPLRRAAEAVRPPGGHLPPHARGAHRALPLRHPVRPERRAARACSRRAEGRSVSTTERILLYCYHYDPQGRHYSLVAMNVMRLGGVVTLVALRELPHHHVGTRAASEAGKAALAASAPSTAGAHLS